MLTGGPLQAASFFSTSSFSPPSAGSNNPITFSCDPVAAGVLRLLDGEKSMPDGNRPPVISPVGNHPQHMVNPWGRHFLCDAGDLHGHSRHYRRQRLDTVHCRQFGLHQRRRHVGGHVLSGCKRRRTTVQQHAALLAFVEAFWVAGVVFLLMIPFLPLLQYAKRVPSQEAPANPEAQCFSRILQSLGRMFWSTMPR